MSGKIPKSQIPLRSQRSLSPDAIAALVQAKNLIRAGGRLREFRNQRGNNPFEGPPLPNPSQGCAYFECDVGQARPDDPLGVRGSKRLVLEVNEKSNQILEVYYTEEHYEKFSFYRVV